MKFRLPALPAAIAAIAAVTLAVGLGACSSAAQAPNSTASSSSTIPQLTIGTNFTMSSLDPTKGGYASLAYELSLETLLKFGPNTTLEPNLATSWAQTSPVTYTYHLRPGVTFWDGTELTAVDVVYAWNYYRSPGSLQALGFASVKSVSAVGRYTVVVTLAHPDASWQYTPAQSAGIFEMKFAESHKGTFGNPGTLIMGTGPWRVDSFDPTRGAELSANPHWWGGTVPIKRITLKLFADETSLALAMRAGEVDLDPYILDTKSFASTSGVRLLSSPSCALGVFGMNTKAGPWSDVHVRRAAAYALNRPDIIAAAAGSNSPIYTYIPAQALREIASPSQVGQLLASVNLYQYSLAKARQELAQSAYPHGFSTTLYEYNYGSSVNISETIAAELQKIGINAHVKVASTLTAWQAVMTGPVAGRQTAFSTGWCGGPDLSSYGFSLGSWNAQPGQWNTADYAPPAVDSLLNAGIGISDPARRFAVYSQLVRRLQSDLPYIGLYLEDTSIALSGKFTVPGFAQHYWQFSSNAYALDVKPAA
jgi:peptide/nickel transport system substrate-binding protein